MSELPANILTPTDSDEYVSWAFKQRGGLQLMADRMSYFQERADTAESELAQLRADLQAAKERIAELEEPLEAFSLAHDLAIASIDSPLLVRYAMQLEQRSAEQARQLEAARVFAEYVSRRALWTESTLSHSAAIWLAANPAAEAEPQP